MGNGGGGRLQAPLRRFGRITVLALIGVAVGPILGLVILAWLPADLRVVAVLVALVVSLPCLAIALIVAMRRSDGRPVAKEALGRLAELETLVSTTLSRREDLEALHEQFQLSHDALRLRYELFATDLERSNPEAEPPPERRC